MTYRRSLVLMLFGIVLSTCLSFAARQRPLAAADLESRVQALEKVVVEQRDELETATRKIEDLERLAAGVGKSCAELVKAVRSSRRNGFESAGPNPQSKTDLLDGLDAFAAGLQKALQPAPEHAEDR